jgi:hypothetical protein
VHGRVLRRPFFVVQRIQQVGLPTLQGDVVITRLRRLEFARFRLLGLR